MNWIIVQTGPNQFSVAHDFRDPKIGCFLVRFANITGLGNAVAIREVANKPINKLPDWIKKHLCSWDPNSRPGEPE